MPPRSPPWKSKYSQDSCSASYLSSLRNNRSVRPTGSRPPPFKSATYTNPVGNGIPRSESAASVRRPDEEQPILPVQDLEQETSTKRWSIPKSTSFQSTVAMKGRPLVHQSKSSMPSLGGRKVSTSGSIGSVASSRQSTEDSVYKESAARRSEREEAHSLREALQHIDHKDEEQRILEAAQNEAADLVWKHRYPQAAEDEKTAAYPNPDLTQQARNSIHSRNKSLDKGIASGAGQARPTPSVPIRSEQMQAEKLKSNGVSGHMDSGAEEQIPRVALQNNSRRRSSGNRHVSNGSSKGVFRNPEDQIYEEPEEVEQKATKPTYSDGQELPLRSRPRNSLPRGSRPLPGKSSTLPALSNPKFDRFEIYRNPPTRSRNAEYTLNATVPVQAEPEVVEEVVTPKTRAMEIRSEEIRAATSMKKKDRSPKLPTPTAVSDRPGRPIVSFDPKWRSGGDSPRTSHDMERPSIRPMPATPAMAVSAPIVPTINLPHEDDNVTPVICVSPADATQPSIPTINLPNDDPKPPSISVSAAPPIPTISVPDETPTSGTPRPLPSIQSKASPARPLPHHSQTSPANLPPSKTSRLPWLQRSPLSGPTVTCSACTLPISGRIVTASGSKTHAHKARLHPECFTCHHCSTPLECVSFYPEPDTARLARLEASDLPPDTPTDLRFYCHLDYHEFFSPRCRSCKTPIEGEVIVAAGAEWHVGHFFCGECGDPFDSSTPFVEKDGYAYCVCCHTKRTSARCKECKRQILDELTVEALGGKWHEECFRCDECKGDFGEEGRFFVRDVEVQPSEKERRRGINRKVEERAVCSACEERRLKA